MQSFNNALRRMILFLGNFTRRAVHYFERGDLIPLMLIVSIPHYALALQGRDLLIVAIGIGLAMDLGQYRVVKAAIRYGGNWWFAAILLTAIALGYHMFYYGGDWFTAFILAAPLPLLIIFLAALSVKERWGAKAANDIGTSDTTAKKGRVTRPNGTDDGAPNDVPNDAIGTRGTYQDFKLAQLARNGNGPMNVNEVMTSFRVPKRTAYRWLSQYREETESVHAPVN